MGFGGTGTSTSIKTATDVSWDNLSSGDTMIFDGSTQKFQNKRPALAMNGGVENVWTNATATGSVTLNLANGNIFNLTLTGNITLAVSGAINGKGCSFTLYLTQGGSGNYSVTTWPSGTKWSGGAPTLSTAANAVDILVFESIDGGATWFGSLVGTNFI